LRLRRTVHGDYQEFLATNRGYRYAVARLVDEYWNLGEIEDVIVATTIGEIALTHEAVFVGSVEYLTRCLSSFNPIDSLGELTKEEINDLSKRISKVKEGLKNVKLDFNPSAEQ